MNLLLINTPTITDFSILTTNINFIEEFSNYYYTSLDSTNQIDELISLDSTFQYLETEIRRRQVKYPHLTQNEIWEAMNSNDSSSTKLALKLYDDLDNLPVDRSNTYTHKGEVFNVAKLSHKEIFNLAKEVDDIDKFESLEHIRSVYIGTSPNVKLYYAEPFIASPSFVHNDIAFLHILQYQFWLWFLFIFLIIFFLLTFLCIVRWCTNRNQPRRETRGVSRSKCGDLITATIPVTWAISIIVSESTDATDYYDGFGTGELIVGVRAYQWGWEYFYPKNIDLNYNVKPSYSSFIGNSLRYNTATSKTLSSNDVWKFYQSKVDDAVITPAHLLVLPLDNSKILNFMSFKNIGTTTLNESAAFKKIRMHSKVYTTNLVHTPSLFTDKYIKLNSLFVNENDLNNSLTFGLKRQHNLTSAAATTNVSSTFLDRNSIDKFLNYNLQYNNSNNQTNLFSQKLDRVTKVDNSQSTIQSLNILSTLVEDSNNYNTRIIKLLVSYPNVIKSIGDNSKDEPIKYPLRKVFNSNFFKGDLINNTALLNAISHETTNSNTTSFLYTNLDNLSSTSKEFNLKSFVKDFNSSEWTNRVYQNLTPNETNHNLSQGFNSLDSNTTRSNLNDVTTNQLHYYNLSNTNWNDTTLLNKLTSSRTYLVAPFAPIMTSNPHLSRINYDNTKSFGYNTRYSANKIIKNVTSNRVTKPYYLLGQRDLPTYTDLTYWKTFWSQTSTDLRLNHVLNTSLSQEFFYMPIFTNYVEYDFRNAQAMEMLEESFWESSYSSYNHYDYLNISDSVLKLGDPTLDPLLSDLGYWDTNRGLIIQKGPKIPGRSLLKPATKDLSSVGNFYSNNIQMDDYISPASLINTKDFSLFPLIETVSSIDDSYLTHKSLVNLFNKNSSLLLNFNPNFLYPQSYLSVLNNFKAGYNNFTWYYDDNSTSLLNIGSPTEGLLNSSNVKTGVELASTNPTRFSNPISLRKTAKSSIVTFMAYQKVFRSRMDEGRSNVRIHHFSDMKIKQPFISDGRVPFEKLLGKNKESFYTTTFYTNNTFSVFNDLAGINNSLNFYFFDFPFLLAQRSDPSRSIWLDWFSKWSLMEVQPSSQAKISIVGTYDYRKLFDFNADLSKSINNVESYFVKLSKARRNYLPLWSYTPYLYTRSNVWAVEDNLLLLNPSSEVNFSTFKKTLLGMQWYWKTTAFSKNTSEFFTPTFSNSHKCTWRPYNSVQGYYYNVSVLTDLLTHREHLYRQYLEKTNKIINLPKILTVNPQNPLINEIKASFLLVDPITYNSEYSREFYYNSLTYFKYLLFKDWVTYLNLKDLPVNTSLINDYLFFYFLTDHQNSKLGNNENLFKSQYRPLKKGITSMLRLHGTGAVAMPIEIRLQILASSRDVIHSWAIPSAGVKIDCIPGYTSHRIMIFFNPGIYWGQCMEICGRYHHWMPIIVYFMKRDLFFLWCTHFMSNSRINSTWDFNDRQFTDYIKFVSYDKTTWLTELGRTT
jgi:heme/copper-type cytochrome/quinol oxidase subunit 2